MSAISVILRFYI